MATFSGGKSLEYIFGRGDINRVTPPAYQEEGLRDLERKSIASLYGNYLKSPDASIASAGFGNIAAGQQMSGIRNISDVISRSGGSSFSPAALAGARMQVSNQAGQAYSTAFTSFLQNLLASRSSRNLAQQGASQDYANEIFRTLVGQEMGINELNERAYEANNAEANEIANSILSMYGGGTKGGGGGAGAKKGG